MAPSSAMRAVWLLQIELRPIFVSKGGKNWKGQVFTLKNVIVCSSNIVRVIKFTRLRWTGHVARMEENGKSTLKTLTFKVKKVWNASPSLVRTFGF